MSALGCTCQSGRDYDGSEFGPCEACERAYDDAAEQASIKADAARWRISQVVYPRTMDDPEGYFAITDDGEWRVGIQPHPVSKDRSINACILGVGRSEADAISDMFRALTETFEQGSTLPPEIEGPRALFEDAQS